MPKKYGTLLSEFLEAVGEAVGFEWPLEYTEAWRRKQLSQAKRKYYPVIYEAKKKGLIRQVSKEGKKFLELTAKGELEKLIGMMGIIKSNKWDQKWRMLIFDIPEDAREKRDKLRWLLKRYGFIKLQASVFISPYSLNREALIYLKQSGLMSYIRIIKVEEIDYDLDLRKKFNL
jgi:CRISPR-associated endonuclease Cas2